MSKRKKIGAKKIVKKVRTMENKKLKSLNLNILNSKKSSNISTQNALKDVTPINWSEDVLTGKKKITVK